MTDTATGYDIDAPEALPDEPGFDADEIDEAEEDAGTGEQKGAPARNRAAEAKLIRRAIAKHEELRTADASAVAIVAALVGAKPDAADLTVAILSGGRIDTSPISGIADLAKLAESDPVEAMFAALGTNRDVLKQQWAILTALGAAEGNLPARDRDAAKALVRAVGSLDSAFRKRLDGVRELLKK